MVPRYYESFIARVKPQYYIFPPVLLFTEIIQNDVCAVTLNLWNWETSLHARSEISEFMTDRSKPSTNLMNEEIPHPNAFITSINGSIMMIHDMNGERLADINMSTISSESQE